MYSPFLRDYYKCNIKVIGLIHTGSTWVPPLIVGLSFLLALALRGILTALFYHTSRPEIFFNVTEVTRGGRNRLYDSVPIARPCLRRFQFCGMSGCENSIHRPSACCVYQYHRSRSEWDLRAIDFIQNIGVVIRKLSKH